MSKIKQKLSCSYCGKLDAITVITKQTQLSRSVKVTKCNNCKTQSGVYSVLNGNQSKINQQ